MKRILLIILFALPLLASGQNNFNWVNFTDYNRTGAATNGNVWRYSDHLYVKLGGVDYQLDQQTGSLTGSGTTNQLTYWTSSTALGALTTSTYPSLTELSYGKGVTSAIQTQLNAKQSTISFGTGVETALGVNIGSAGAPVLFNGAGGTPSSLTGTNITGTASSFNVGTAATLTTARNIQGVSFNGSAAIDIINGTGFVKASGTTLSYDNSTYLTTSSAASTYQPLDSDLTTISGLTATTDNFLVSVSSAWASRTPAQVKTTLSLNLVENAAASGLYLPIASPAYTGILTLGTLGFSDTDILASFQKSVNSYAQIVAQNTSSGVTASISHVLASDNATASTHYLELGRNSSGFTGSGSLNGAGYGYLTNTSEDLVMGTTTAHSLRFLTNSATTDAYVISSTHGHSFAQTAQSATNTFVTFTQSVHTGGSPVGLLFTGGAHTGLDNLTEAVSVNFNLSQTVQFLNGVGPTTQRAFIIQAPTYSHVAGTTRTIATAATFAVTGSPTAGTATTITDAYSLWVQSGRVRIDANASTTKAALSVKDASSSGGLLLDLIKSSSCFTVTQEGRVTSAGTIGSLAASGAIYGINNSVTGSNNGTDYVAIIDISGGTVTTGTNSGNIAYGLKITDTFAMGSSLGNSLVGLYWNPTVTGTISGSDYGALIGRGLSGFGTLTPTYVMQVKGLSTNQNLFVVQEDGGTNLIEAKETAGVKQLSFFAATPVAQQTGNLVTALSNLGLVTSGTIPGTQLTGTTTNDAASAGNIGENARSNVNTYTNFTTTATYQNVASITLAAGDYDISADFTFSSNTATITAAADAIFVISTTTASAAGAIEGESIAYVPQAALLGTSHESGAIAPYRVSISGSTTYYLNAQATFTIGNPQYVGTIRARRIR